MRRARRVPAVIGVLVLALLTGAGTFALLDAFHAPLVSGWDAIPGAVIVLTLAAGLSFVFADAAAPLWELTLTVVVCLLLAFTAYVSMGFVYVCAHETCP